ncbi:MAG: aldo/keto reductase, partial [Gammaproteobacteria bacterium]
MNQITIGSDRIPRLGYGCMGLTQAYQPVDLVKATALLRRIADEGSVMLDTAATYSGGKNEILVGSALKTSRSNVFLASKAGMYKNPDGSREIDGDPDRIIRSCEESLSRLGTDVLDLFYLHRVDHRVPVEDSVGAIDRLITDGKVRHAGLSEVSRSTLERAMSITKIHAVQSEYSLWSRRVEDGVLGYCGDNGIALVAYSPVGRGFLAGGVRDMTRLSERDIRHGMPRFQGDAF